jgi:hypothetical protein
MGDFSRPPPYLQEAAGARSLLHTARGFVTQRRVERAKARPVHHSIVCSKGTLAHPDTSATASHNGADAVLSEGRYCMGSTGAEFLRISKCSCGVAAVPVCPDFRITCPL